VSFPCHQSNPHWSKPYFREDHFKGGRTSIEIDEPVPAEHFKAVAQVIGYVFRPQGKIKAN
jgi:hypothetical protein